MVFLVPVDEKAHHLGRGKSGLGAHLIRNVFDRRKDGM
jgi:hypothetical protein